MFISLNTERYADIDEFLKSFFEQLRSFYMRRANSIMFYIYEASSAPTHSERLSTRTANISDPEQLLLLEQLLENLELEEPTSQLAYINSNKGLKPYSGSDAKLFPDGH
jgi:hypothetical protein